MLYVEGARGAGPVAEPSPGPHRPPIRCSFTNLFFRLFSVQTASVIQLNTIYSKLTKRLKKYSSIFLTIYVCET